MEKELEVELVSYILTQRSSPSRFRIWAIIFFAVTCTISGRASSRAQGPAQKAQVMAASVEKARNAVDQAATNRNMVLTDGAKREVAIEAVRQEAAAQKSAQPGEIPDVKVDQLLKSIQTAVPGVPLDADHVKQAVIDSKSSQIRSTLEQDVNDEAAAAGLRLPDEVRMRLVGDLEKQTAGLAASGLSVDVIKEKNQAYFKGILQNLHGTPITGTSYTQAARAIFQQFVNLRIESVPTGAHVKMNNIEIGLTDIPSQPLEPGEMYQFEFALMGYKTAARAFFVSAGDTSAVLREPLEPEPATGDREKNQV
jgi:hypothetical protein